MKKISILTLAMLIHIFIALPVEAAKNVILIIPDGCSATMWAAIRAMTVGVDGLINVDRLPVQGRCRTYSADSFITDSAAAGTAYACGVKTNNGVLGRDAGTVRADSLSGKPVSSILELAEKAGYATGLVTTTPVTHATPASFYTHRAERGWYNLIGGDLVGKGIEVIMGGGRNYMIPKGAIDEEGAPSKRNDGRNIIQELRREGYVYVYDRAGFNLVDPKSTDKLLCLFNTAEMQFELNRPRDIAGEPGLWEMTEKALKILSKNKKGFFLLIESGIIDYAAHKHLTPEFLREGIACDKTVGVAMEFTRKNRGTLLIVVPDHCTGGPSLVGMHDLSTPDSSVVTKGFPHYSLNTEGIPVSDGGRPVAIQWVKSMGHNGEDVTISAMGPHSEEMDGVIQNTDVFRIMGKHLGVLKDNHVVPRKGKNHVEWPDF